MMQINYDRRSPEVATKEPVVLPCSKSMAARELVLSYIEGRESPVLEGVLCDDTRYLAEGIDKLREVIPSLPEYMTRFNELHGGQPDVIVINDPIYLGDGAATFRFFTALVASIPGLEVELGCSKGLARRPLSPLLNALRDRGAVIRSLNHDGYPPLHIEGRRLKGGEIDLRGSKTSQFLSALMMVEKLWDGASSAIYYDKVSLPYVDMTRRMMESSIDKVEPDWSAAAFFYEAFLLSELETLEFLRLTPPTDSLQGDKRCVEIFSKLGVVTEFRDDGSSRLYKNQEAAHQLRLSKQTVCLDMKDTPDLVMPVAVAMGMSGIRFEISGVETLAYKESNRILSLKNEFEKVGISLQTADDEIKWDGAKLPTAENEVVECWDDHRIAMSFAPVASKTGYITLRGEECVSKSFPDYFAQLEKLGYKLRKIMKP